MAIRTIMIGSTVTLVLPYSEVNMHMRVAGQIRNVKVLPDNSAQILNSDGSPFSFPVLWGEAGIGSDGDGRPIVLATVPDRAQRILARVAAIAAASEPERTALQFCTGTVGDAEDVAGHWSVMRGSCVPRCTWCREVDAVLERRYSHQSPEQRTHTESAATLLHDRGGWTSEYRPELDAFLVWTPESQSRTYRYTPE